MAHRRIGQLGFADAVIAARAGARRDGLAEVGKLIDWSRFEALLAGLYPAAKGEPAYPPLMMFKVLLLQRWYELSDPGMEEALADRLSFRHFAGLALEDATPDHSTIWRFRELLATRGLAAALLAELARQLDAHRVVLRKGTLIDATLVSSAARRPRMGEGQTSPADPDAAFGANNERGRFTFGYKLHVAVDAGSGLVRDLRLTPANVQEITVAEQLVQGDEAAVYADRGYDSDRLHLRLADLGIANGIMRRNRPKHPLTLPEIAHNHLLSLRRRPVEAVFGTLKRCYGFARMPYFNQARNRVAATFACFAYNLRRLLVLAPA